MNELAVEDTDFSFHAHRAYSFSPQLDPHPDEVLDNLVSALRTTMAHPDQTVQALAEATLFAVRRIQQASRRRLAEQQRGGERSSRSLGPAAISLEAITVHVASALRIAPDELQSRSRKQHVAFCRQVAMYLCRKITSNSFPTIGEHFHRDHSTVIHAFNLIGRRKARDAAFGLSIETLERELTASVTTTTAAAA